MQRCKRQEASRNLPVEARRSPFSSRITRSFGCSARYLSAAASAGLTFLQTVVDSDFDEGGKAGFGVGQ